ncbi:MAG: hypothetical protein PG981_001532 [Wolbachia endosymbiont of Ctenocephalides orientis wCori]|nr:MAG: hypothetical protein PG981_001532 [Wolbachia endosymbiont of Ctenocephalides orientis wCori]
MIWLMFIIKIAMDVMSMRDKHQTAEEPDDGKLCSVVRIKKYLAELSGVQNKWPRGEQLTLT